MEKELSELDFDMMVLHYLGLDHIGHIAGPFSPLIGPKLKEMDDIIRNIYQELSKVLFKYYKNQSIEILFERVKITKGFHFFAYTHVFDEFSVGYNKYFFRDNC